MAQCISAMRAPYLAMQHNVHWHGHCVHALMSCIAPTCTKLASSAARTANYNTAHHPHTMRAPHAVPSTGDLPLLSHTGRRLNGFILAIAVLASTSRLCIRVAAQDMNSTMVEYVAAGVSLHVVARYGAHRLAMALMPSEGGKLSTLAATVRESADLSQVLCGSCNGESNGLSLLSVACVSHELHARKILNEDDYE